VSHLFQVHLRFPPRPHPSLLCREIQQLQEELAYLVVKGSPVRNRTLNCSLMENPIFIFVVFLYSSQIKCSPLTVIKSLLSFLKKEHRHHCTQNAEGISFYIVCQSLDIMRLVTQFHLGGGEYKLPSHTDLVAECNSCRCITGITIKNVTYHYNYTI